MRSRGARVSTSVRPACTATSSSMRMPPRPSAYTPGSIVITFPGSSRRACPLASLGSSCTLSQAMTRTVDEKMVLSITCQDLSRGSVDVPAGDPLSYCRDRRFLRLQNRLIPRADAFRGAPRENRAGNVAAIVAEYNTQVQHDQLIFPQSLASRPGVRQGRPVPKGNNGFKRRPRGSALAHLVFDLCHDLPFAHAGLQQADRKFHDLPCQDGRLAHLGQFSRVFAHSKPFHHARHGHPLPSAPRGFPGTLKLRYGHMDGIESHSAGPRIPEDPDR